ncbi:hypothetical protein M422DRAFT_248655 [Sphaerobolus stellatus SS14]|nr:hypothetical protein M422DRAFT_248655 [Sphaerobolus stellatus SS14]
MNTNNNFATHQSTKAHLAAVKQNLMNHIQSVVSYLMEALEQQVQHHLILENRVNSVKEELIATPSLTSTAAWPSFSIHAANLTLKISLKGCYRVNSLSGPIKLPFMTFQMAGAELTMSEACNAKKHRMTSVTPYSIAYFASQVRFVLSSSSTNTKTGGPFCFGTFFWHAVKYLEDPLFEDDVKELVEWWNKQILPEAKPEIDMLEEQDSL